MFWNSIPSSRLILPFIAGILFAVYSEFILPHSEFILITLFVFVLLLSTVRKLLISYGYTWIFGVVLNLSLLLGGYYLTILNTDKFDGKHYAKFLDGTEYFYVQATQPYLEKDKSLKLTMKVLAVKKNNQWISTKGRAMFYFNKNEEAKKIKYGDFIVLKTIFKEVPPPQNPSEFNYKRFLSFHNITQQAYVKSNEWKFTRTNEGNTILSCAFSLREYLLVIFHQYNITGDEFAVGSALVLGYTDKLDQDIITAYASSGALHVLSVSGLHVGIVYIVFNFMFLFLDKFKKGKILKAGLLLLIVWFYTILTGLSPSVLRAATMFSFIIIAKTFNYNTNIFNTLCVSCFVLLLINPYMIMDVGFQLSYLAVLGIVYIQPKIYDLWTTDSWIAEQVWALITVSIAAQIATFPLGLFYFHQFPNYFLFSNLIVIPVSTLILYLGILIFFFSKWTIAATFLSFLLSHTIRFLNDTVKFIEEAPYALLQGISISVFETCMIYLLILMLLTYAVRKRLNYLLCSLSLIIFILGFQIYENFKENNQKRFIVYNIPKTSAMDFISGKQTIFLADSALINSNSKTLFHVQHNWWGSGLDAQVLLDSKKTKTFNDDSFCFTNNFIKFHEKKIVVITSKPKKGLKKFKLDYLLISENPKMKIKDLTAAFEFKKIIIDSSNSKWKSEKWKKECDDLKINCYSVLESGAYVEEI